MIRWQEVHDSLKALKLYERKALFREFKDLHPNWSPTTFDALSAVVVRLWRQVDVCKTYNVRKQALNRSVRHYRFFIARRKNAS